MLVILTVTPSVADTVHLSDDTFMYDANPLQPYGNRKNIYVGTLASGAKTQGYVKFDLLTLPADANVSKATLRVYINRIWGNGQLGVHEVLADWMEEDLTTNAAPLVGTAFTSIPVDQTHNEFYVMVDVTDVVQSWMLQFTDYELASFRENTTRSMTYKHGEANARTAKR